MGKKESIKIENRLNGETAEIKQTASAIIIEKETKPTMSAENIVVDDEPKAETAKVVKVDKDALKDIDKEVLVFCKSLDHPATTNEVRDRFNFPLRANARRIFKKLERLGYGEDKKIGNRYLFHVKAKKYAKEPPSSQHNRPPKPPAPTEV